MTETWAFENSYFSMQKVYQPSFLSYPGYGCGPAPKNLLTLLYLVSSKVLGVLRMQLSGSVLAYYM